MTDAERAVVMFIWDDSCRLIAALKTQRWEVMKWTVTVNLALGAASAAEQFNSQHIRWLFFVFAVAVALIGWALVYHYNERATKVRSRLGKVTEAIRAQIFDYNTHLGIEVGYAKGSNYDHQELIAFFTVIGTSILPALIVWQSLP